ncbi:MAG: tetratricopeptide repeat protein [Gemmatimonadales bacterium]|nr:tetratricopeptide repeat protein [Gemmatimonadales bacterium]
MPSVPAPTGLLADPKSRLMVGGLAAAVVVLGVWFVQTSNRRKEVFALKALDKAQSIAESGNLPAASTEFQRIVETYGGTPAAGEATLALNQVRLLNGQAELAVTNLRDALSAGRLKGDAAAGGYALLGSALENTGKFAEAAEAFGKAVNASALGYLKSERLLDQARAFGLAGKPADAAKAYETIIRDFSETPAKSEAEVRLAELKAAGAK